MTLVVGGHIDHLDREARFEGLVANTLTRELEEEVGLRHSGSAEIVGVVIDRTTAAGARHLGIVHRVSVPSGRLKALAQEEFSLRSKYSGVFLDVRDIAQLYSKLDAWSALLFENLLSPGFHTETPLRRQLQLPLALENNGGGSETSARKSLDAGARALNRSTGRPS
jgi:ADP-ribose pyrophosphatase YjhB (NUDIX family)